MPSSSSKASSSSKKASNSKGRANTVAKTPLNSTGTSASSAHGRRASGSSLDKTLLGLPTRSAEKKHQEEERKRAAEGSSSDDEDDSGTETRKKSDGKKKRGGKQGRESPVKFPDAFCHVIYTTSK